MRIKLRISSCTSAAISYTHLRNRAQNCSNCLPITERQLFTQSLITDRLQGISLDNIFASVQKDLWGSWILLVVNSFPQPVTLSKADSPAFHSGISAQRSCSSSWPSCSWVSCTAHPHTTFCDIHRYSVPGTWVCMGHRLTWQLHCWMTLTCGRDLPSKSGRLFPQPLAHVLFPFVLKLPICFSDKARWYKKKKKH